MRIATKGSNQPAPSHFMRADDARIKIQQMVEKFSAVSDLTDADREKLIAQAESIGWQRIESMFQRVLRLAAAHLVCFGTEDSRPTLIRNSGESYCSIEGLR